MSPLCKNKKKIHFHNTNECRLLIRQLRGKEGLQVMVIQGHSVTRVNAPFAHRINKPSSVCHSVFCSIGQRRGEKKKKTARQLNAKTSRDETAPWIKTPCEFFQSKLPLRCALLPSCRASCVKLDMRMQLDSFSYNKLKPFPARK